MLVLDEIALPHDLAGRDVDQPSRRPIAAKEPLAALPGSREGGLRAVGPTRPLPAVVADEERRVEPVESEDGLGPMYGIRPRESRFEFKNCVIKSLKYVKSKIGGTSISHTNVLFDFDKRKPLPLA